VGDSTKKNELGPLKGRKFVQYRLGETNFRRADKKGSVLEFRRGRLGGTVRKGTGGPGRGLKTLETTNWNKRKRASNQKHVEVCDFIWSLQISMRRKFNSTPHRGK